MLDPAKCGGGDSSEGLAAPGTGPANPSPSDAATAVTLLAAVSLAALPTATSCEELTGGVSVDGRAGGNIGGIVWGYSGE